MRSFQDTLAVREQVPFRIGLVGPTGSGKTGSALELSTGLQDVQGGDIWVIDNEGKRALSYAPDAQGKGGHMFSEPSRQFKFRHLDFKAPYSPQDFREAGEYAISKGAKHIIFDSGSHMWEGAGGILQSHEAEVERLKIAWNKTNDKDVTFAAWNKGKTQQTSFILWMKGQPINFIFCFRAKDKMQMVDNKPTAIGWQAIGGEDLLYEMEIACLLLPECDGKPIWNKKDDKGVKALHAQFRPIFADNPRLSAAVGRKLAEWSKGTAQAPAPAQAQASTPKSTVKQDAMAALTKAATTLEDLGQQFQALQPFIKDLSDADKAEIVAHKDKLKNAFATSAPAAAGLL